MRLTTACCALAAVACAALAAAPLASAAAAAAPVAAAAAAAAAAAGAAAAAALPLPAALQTPLLPRPQLQLDVCSLHYATDVKQTLGPMELAYRAGMCVVAARTVGSSCDPSPKDDAVLLGPFACDAPVALGAVGARLAADAARRANGSGMPSVLPPGGISSLAGPGLNAWVSVQGPAPKLRNGTRLAAGARASHVCSLTLQEPTKVRKRMARAPDAPVVAGPDGEVAAPGAAGRSSYMRGMFALTGLGCRAGVSPARASVDAAADALLGGPAEQRRPFTFGLWVAPEGPAAGDGPAAPGAKAAPSSCRLVVSAQAPAAERIQAMQRSAVAGDAYLGAEAVTCEHVVPQAQDEGLLTTGCCYGGRR